MDDANRDAELAMQMRICTPLCFPTNNPTRNIAAVAICGHRHLYTGLFMSLTQCHVQVHGVCQAQSVGSYAAWQSHCIITAALTTILSSGVEILEGCP